MKDEIKEILYCDIYNDLDDEKYNKLLDYITNLQEENVNLKTKLRWKENRIDKTIRLIKEAGCYVGETRQFYDDIWEELPDESNKENKGE